MEPLGLVPHLLVARLYPIAPFSPQGRETPGVEELDIPPLVETYSKRLMLLLLDEMSATNPDEDTNQGEDEAGKSQRKRERERQRRTEMAGAFNDLSQLLHELDPDNADSFSGSRRRRRRGSDGDEFDLAADGSGMTRLLLINRATEMLRTLRTENINLRHRLQMAGGADDKVNYSLFLWRTRLTVC